MTTLSGGFLVVNKSAVRQAWERLHRAEAAYQRLCSAISIGQAEAAWSEFLTAASAIYSKLETGSKGHPKSEPWFGRIKNERKFDPLLSYIHHARNSDEHGIEQITDGEDGTVTITARGSVHLNMGQDGKPIDPNGPFAVPTNAESAVILDIVPPKLRLVPVFDNRFKDTFDVPAEHMGLPLVDQSPIAVSALGIRYLNRIIRDGAKLAQ